MSSVATLAAECVCLTAAQAIDQICGFLGIHCLTIPGPTDGAVEKEVAVGSRGTEGDAKDL